MSTNGISRRKPETMDVEQFRAEFGQGHKPKYRTFARLDCMNKLEAAWSAELDAMKAAGEIRCWMYDAVNLRLARATHYRPDFLVVMADGSMRFYETKGHWREDAKVKIKVAAAHFPMFSFIAVRRIKRQWEFEQF